jgi:cation:H+ antiporter
VVHVVLLIACAGAIYLSCEWFVNAVEWLGQRLNIGTMAVGTILAAFGTALPESVVTLVAVTTGPTAEIRNIGVWSDATVRRNASARESPTPDRMRHC